MFVSTLLALVSLFSSPAASVGATPPVAGVISLKEARAKGPGATVSVRGVVLNGPELGALRFIQDGESGLALYALPKRVPGYDELRAGDSLQVTGQLKNYNGLLEMDPVAAVHKVSGGRLLRPLLVPATAMSPAFAEANESRLVQITGLHTITTLGGTPAEQLAANTNYRLNGQAGAQLRVNSASTGAGGVVDLAVPHGEPFAVCGVMSQFSPSGTDGYQLLPRLATDFIHGGGLPELLAEPVPVEITPQGFTLVYTTRYPGDTRVSYGPSASQLTEERMVEELSTQHRIVLTELTPGTTYYVRASSRNAAGMAQATPVPVITAGRKRK